MEFKASNDNLVKIITLLTILIAIFFSFKSVKYLITNENKDTVTLITNISIIIFFILLILLTWMYSPVSYYLNDDYLIINRHFGKVYIKIKDIKNIEKLNDDDVKGTIRYFGVGGLFGYYGKYYIPNYGKVKFYATQNKNRILIETTNNEKILITPDNIDLYNELRKKFLNP